MPPAQCLLCASETARVYCEADQAFLCAECDVKIHSSNALAARHARVPVCELCKSSASKVYCANDKAFLCSGCNDDVHLGNPLAARHTIVPVMQALAQEQSAAAACDCDAHSEAAGMKPQARLAEEGETSALLQGSGSDAVVPSLADAPAPEAQQPASSSGKEKWGKEFDFLDLDNAWLDRLETGMDFSDILDDAALVPTFDGPISQDGEDHDGLGAVPEMQGSPRPTSSDNSLGLSLDFMVPSIFGEVPFSGPPAVQSQPTVLPQQLQQQAPAPVQQHQPMQLQQQCFPASAALNAMHAQQQQQQAVPATYASLVSSPYYPNPSSFPQVSRDQAAKNREACLERYKLKRTTRKFEKTIRYASRKAYAEIRPRIKGRFARKDEIDEWIRTGIVPEGVVGWNGQALS